MGKVRGNINGQGSKGFMDIVVVVTVFLTFIGGNVLSEAFIKALIKVRGFIIELALIVSSELGFGLFLFFLGVFP
jgi:hypothetical protein